MTTLQGHVVDLVLAAIGPVDAELNSNVTHVGRLLPRGVDLFMVHPELKRNASFHIVAFVHHDVAKSMPGRIELQGSSIPEMLSAHELLFRRVQLILEGDALSSDQSDVLGPEGVEPSVEVFGHHEAEFHLQSLDQKGKPVITGKLLPVDEDFVRRDRAHMSWLQEPIPSPLVVVDACSKMPSIGIHLEVCRHSWRGSPLLLPGVTAQTTQPRKGWKVGSPVRQVLLQPWLLNRPDDHGSNT
mmetsp:Transcript_11930/g.28453  ORF Transcript_11930/g.28453 Transcript_11930/m.28453 type:complete len:242 (+) Transcript_11930:385-1110(+)